MLVENNVNVFLFFKQKTAYEVLRSLVGSEMCIRDSIGIVFGVWLALALITRSFKGGN